MKRFCMSLCVLTLLSTSLFAEKKTIQNSKEKPCTPCQGAKSGNIHRPKSFPCICALYEIGGIWIAEEHPENTNCQAPIQRTLSGDQPIGNCITIGCTGDGCKNIAPAPCPPTNATKSATSTPVPEPKPILEEPLPMKENPPPTKYIKFMDPRFIKIKLPHKKKRILAKVYTAVINVRQIAEDENREPRSDANPKPPSKKKIKLHPMRGECHIHMIGFQTNRIPKKMKVETFKPMKDHCGNPKVDSQLVMIDFGLYNGYVLLAPAPCPPAK